MKEERTLKIKLKGFTPKQREIATDIINEDPDKTKYYVIRASRKSGKSWLLERLCVFFPFKYPGSQIGFISASWHFTTDFYRDLIKIIPKTLIKKTNINASIEFVNGSIIDFYSAASNILPVNRTFSFLFADEHALYRKDVWDYLRPTILASKNAKVIIASTPRGKNTFYNMCMDGIEGRNRTKQYRMSYLDNPNIDLKQVEDDRASMPIQLFNQEYMCEFTDAISSIFGDFKSLLTINAWQDPDIAKNKYFGGLDISGVGGDKTVLTIIDVNGNICYIYEVISTDIVDQAKELEPIIKKYNAICVGEKNGIGQGLIDVLKSMYVNISYFDTTPQSKQALVTNTILNINNKTVNMPSVDLCPKLENEMSCYSGKRTHTGHIRYEGEAGVHDDYVMSLMFALESKRKNMSVNYVYDSTDDIFEISDSNNFANHSSFAERHNLTWADDIKYDY